MLLLVHSVCPIGTETPVASSLLLSRPGQTLARSFSFRPTKVIRNGKRREAVPGIDHTAIVVANTEASLKFYRDALGLQIAGTSENYGTEQEHLNNVFGARLRITSLRAGSGGRRINFSVPCAA